MWASGLFVWPSKADLLLADDQSARRRLAESDTAHRDCSVLSLRPPGLALLPEAVLSLRRTDFRIARICWTPPWPEMLSGESHPRSRTSGCLTNDKPLAQTLGRLKKRELQPVLLPGNVVNAVHAH